MRKSKVTGGNFMKQSYKLLSQASNFSIFIKNIYILNFSFHLLLINSIDNFGR